MKKEFVNNQKIIWLASYPRSGNTFLRTILWQCFGLRSGSVYPNDLGGNKELEDYVGHIPHDPGGEISFPFGNLPLVKTHEGPLNELPAIYVVRDGRAACVSIWKYFKDTVPLEAIITGQIRFGKWADHVLAWKPYERPNTLLLKYENMRNDLPGTLHKISTFLKRDILKKDIPERNTIASVDGRWVKPKSDWRTEISDEMLGRFNTQNKDMLIKLGYL